MTINKINGASWADDISKVSGIATANISKIGGDAAPASGPTAATEWVTAGRDSAIAYITGTPSSFTDWSEYVDPNNSKDYIKIGFGEDGSGGDMWIGTRNQGNGEMFYATDPTSGDGSWSIAGNFTHGSLGPVDWGDGKWVVGGNMSNIQSLLTSSTGTTWGYQDISGLSGITTDGISGIATDGDGFWAFTQNDRIYSSSDNAVTWALAYTFTGSEVTKDLAHTTNANNASVFAIAYIDGQNDGWAAAALASDLTTWTSADGQVGDIGGNTDILAAGGGTIIAVNSNDQLRSTDAGTTWVRDLNVLARGSVESIATDGAGNWVCGHQNGYITYSTDDGATWSDAKDTGGERWQGVACNNVTKDKQ